MTEKRTIRVGRWVLNLSELVLGSLAAILAIGQSALILWKRFGGKSWYEMWPTGMSVFAMLLVLLSIGLRARARALDGNRR